MIEALTEVLESEPRVAYALLFGSAAEGRLRGDSDVDLAVGFVDPLTTPALLDLISRLEDTAGRPIDLTDLARAGPVIAFRVFRNGQVLFCRDRRALVDRKARAISEYLDWRPMEQRFIAGVLGNGRGRRAKLVVKVAAIRDAIERIGEVLPADVESFVADRTAREVVTLNLLVAIQDAVDLASHWIADEGWVVPDTYRQVFLLMAEKGVLTRETAEAMAASASLRNLVAHRYGELQWDRMFDIASGELGVFESFCAALVGAAAELDVDPSSE